MTSSVKLLSECAKYLKDACKLMWEQLTNDEKKAVIAIPNFDPKVFEEITGILI